MGREILDLIIIGAGPGGISTALHLLQQDSSWAGRMIVIEKAVHPRHKLCGGGVTLFGLKILRDLGIAMPLPIPQARVENIYFRCRNRKIHVRGQPQFIVFNRSEFDHYLVQEARRRGIHIQEGEAVESLDVESDQVRVTTSKGEYRAKMVVGADGSLGVVRRTLGGRAPQKRVARLLEVVTPARPDSALFTRKAATFDFDLIHKDLQGYFWVFPSLVGGQPAFNRGLYDSRMVENQPRADMLNLFDESMPSLGAATPPKRPSGHPIHWFHPRNRMSGFRTLLVGDAAGAEVLFGEGIAPALGYGKVAARAIEVAVRSGDFSFRHYRRQVLRSSVGRYLRLRYNVAWWVYHFGRQAWFMHPFWTGCQILALFWQPKL